MAAAQRAGSKASFRATASLGVDNRVSTAQVSVVLVSRRERLAGVMTGLLLLAYASVLQPTFLLLHCVSVPGKPASKQFLFYDATMECHHHHPLLAALAFTAALFVPVVLLPLAVAWAKRAHKRGGSGAGTAAYRQLVAVYDFRRGHVVEHWESVMMCHRLVVLAVATFVSHDPLLRALLLLLVMALSLLAQLLLRPMRSAVANVFQTLLLVCQLIVVCLSFPQAERQLLSPAPQQHIVSGSLQHDSRAIAVLSDVVAYVVPVVGFVVAQAVSYARVRHRNSASSSAAAACW